jgi:hypothetical protein
LYVNPDQVKKEFENLIDPVMKQSFKLSALRKKEMFMKAVVWIGNSE